MISQNLAERAQKGQFQATDAVPSSVFWGTCWRLSGRN